MEREHEDHKHKGAKLTHEIKMKETKRIEGPKEDSSRVTA